MGKMLNLLLSVFYHNKKRWFEKNVYSFVYLTRSLMIWLLHI